jgi:hypothetical protein
MSATVGTHLTTASERSFCLTNSCNSKALAASVSAAADSRTAFCLSTSASTASWKASLESNPGLSLSSHQAHAQVDAEQTAHIAPCRTSAHVAHCRTSPHIAGPEKADSIAHCRTCVHSAHCRTCVHIARCRQKIRPKEDGRKANLARFQGIGVLLQGGRSVPKMPYPGGRHKDIQKSCCNQAGENLQISRQRCHVAAWECGPAL